LLEVFLADVLKIDPDKVHIEACRLEHYMSEETANALCRWLEAPSRSPHGKPIGPCDKPLETCLRCEETNAAGFIRTAGEHEIIPVADLEPDQEGEIAFIRGDQKTVWMLSDLGLEQKTTVKMRRISICDGPIELIVGDATLAIASNLADNIFVKLA
jgi:DtxR family Mn-dependent transcriptional regulator